jgi:hypothetical protein
LINSVASGQWPVFAELFSIQDGPAGPWLQARVNEFLESQDWLVTNRAISDQFLQH